MLKNDVKGSGSDQGRASFLVQFGHSQLLSRIRPVRTYATRLKSPAASRTLTRARGNLSRSLIVYNLIGLAPLRVVVAIFPIGLPASPAKPRQLLS